MKTLGVTGGIGSGKSAVCRIFEDLGARVFYADAEAKKLMHDDAGARAEIVSAFGRESYDAAGNLDRGYLAGQVFGDAARLAQLNAIVHPRVRQRLLEAKEAAARDGVALLVYEAALIYETGGEDHVDAVAVVEAPVEVRVARVVARDGVPPEAVRARLQHQLPPEELRRRADYLIENTGSLEDLRQQVEAVYAAVLA